MPEQKYDPAEFMRLTGTPSRTFRAALAWLIEEGIIASYRYSTVDFDEDDFDEPYAKVGFIIPFNPKIRCPDVQKAIAKARAEAPCRKVNSGAKRSLTAIFKRQEKKARSK